MHPNPNNRIWIDLEMTGLNPLYDHIIEIATVITDKDLEIIAKGPVFAIHQPDTILERMDNWNIKQHTRSGLLARVKDSQTTVQMAEEITLDFIMQHVPPNKSPMCGNTICQDRRFLFQYMPVLEKYFHYRNLDVSVLKELAYLWKPDLLNGFEKKSQHLALEDAMDSIRELKYYRDTFLKLD